MIFCFSLIVSSYILVFLRESDYKDGVDLTILKLQLLKSDKKKNLKKIFLLFRLIADM